jgi:putative ABC transport system permease protein
MLFSIFIAVGFSVLGALRGVKAVIRLSPAEAMHPSPPACGGTILLEKWTWFWKKLDFRWQMALRGLFRNKGRTIIGVCASMLGGAILLLAMGLSDSMTYMIVFQFGKILKCDYTMSFRSDVDGGALYEAERLPGVTYVEPQLNVSCNFQNGNHVKKGGITGIIHDAKLTVPCSSDGKPVRVPPVGLLMTKRLAEKLHLGPGDTVRVIPVKGNRTPKYVKIAGIIDTTFGLAVYADYKYLNFLVGEEAAINELQMNARQTPEQKREFFKQVKKYPELSSIGIIPLQKKNIIEDFVAKMKGFTYVMIIFAGVIFFGSILNSALVSLAERQREIATFRVLGYQPLEVGEIFLRETMLVNMIGALLGLPLGYYMLWGMCLQFQNDMYSVPSVIYPMSWIYTLIWAFVFVLGAYLIIQRSINRMDWSEALKMKE